MGIGPVTASRGHRHGRRLHAVQERRAVRCLVRHRRRASDSSGGKTKLGRITKRGDTYLRTLLIQGAKSAVMTAHKRSDPISRWALALRERSGWQKAVVALANKNARILWAVMTKGEHFDPNHVSVKPDLAGMSTLEPSSLHRRERRRCTDRSDRRRASSTNPWWRDTSAVTTR